MPEPIANPPASPAAASAPAAPAAPAPASTEPASAGAPATPPAAPAADEPKSFKERSGGFKERLAAKMEAAEARASEPPAQKDPSGKATPKPEVKPEVKPEAKAELEDGAPKPDAKTGEQAPAGDKTAEKKPEEGAEGTEPKPAEIPADAPRLTFAGKDGKPVEVPWPEGAVLKFKGAGRTQTVESPERMIELMQMGADYSRATSRLGEERKHALDTLKRSQEGSQKVLLAVLFGDGERSPEEIQDELRSTLQKFLDPDYRAGIDAQTREAEARARADRERSETTESWAAQVWDDAEEYVGGALGNYDFLEPSDTQVVKQMLHREYEAQFNAKLQEFLPEMRAGTISAEAVQERAEQHARQYLSTSTLDALMSRLNGEYQRRLARKGGGTPPADAGAGAPPSPTDESARTEAEIAAHNGRTASKLTQQERTRTLRGAGSPPPAGAGVPSTEGMTWAEKRKAHSERIRSLGSSG